MPESTSSRLLVTGADGFVGRHVVAAWRNSSGMVGDLLATCRHSPNDDPTAQRFERLDITDAAAISEIVSSFKPTHVLHLAAMAAPSRADVTHRELWNVNTLATLDLAHAIRRSAPSAWLLFASSGLVYGDTANEGGQLDEKALLAPSNPYAASKAAADLALGAMAKEGLRVIRFRPFNHTGPGQSEEYVIPSFAGQIARIEAGIAPPIIKVGDLSAERDFMDVRCVVDAYLAAVQRSETLVSGSVFNLASGKPRKLRTVLDSLLAQSHVPIEIEVDPARLRPSDTPRYVGAATAAAKVLDWKPVRDFDQTLAAILEAARCSVGRVP